MAKLIEIKYFVNED